MHELYLPAWIDKLLLTCNGNLKLVIYFTCFTYYNFFSGVQRDSLVPCDTAIKLLNTIKKPLAVLSIAGPARTGKSYILSRLLGDPEAFQLGHTVHACTKGIWMSTSVLECSKFCVVLLDTEGIDSVNDQASNDAKILVTTLLLSSYFIYNSQNVPRSSDLEKMR